jgi:hypothetical protein
LHQPLGIVGGFVVALLTLVVPLAGVVLDRHGQPVMMDSVDRSFTPFAAAESPENPAPGRRAPDR